MATVQRYVNTASTAGGDGTTNATSGSTRAYASLSEWEANAGGSATDDYVVDCCGGQDTTSVTVDFTTNITTGSVTIRANTGEADGFYDGDAVISTSHYYLDPGNVTSALRFSETRCTADGIQIVAAHSGLNGYAILTSSSEFTVRRCRLLNSSSTDYGVGNSASLGSSTPRLVENNLVVGFDVSGIAVIVTNFATPTVTIQHNTIYGDGSSTSGGIRYGSSGAGSGTTFNIKGNAVGNCGSGNDLIKTSGASTTDNFDDNAFEYSESTSGEIALGTLTDAWTSPGTSTSSDFTVKNSSSPLNFTVTGSLVSTDIRGTTRSNYSVGAFEFFSSSAAVSSFAGRAGSASSSSAAKSASLGLSAIAGSVGSASGTKSASAGISAIAGLLAAMETAGVGTTEFNAIAGALVSVTHSTARLSTIEGKVGSIGSVVGLRGAISSLQAIAGAIAQIQGPLSDDRTSSFAAIAGAAAALSKTTARIAELAARAGVLGAHTAATIRAAQLAAVAGLRAAIAGINVETAGKLLTATVSARSAFDCAVSARSAYNCSISEAIIQ